VDETTTRVVFQNSFAAENLQARETDVALSFVLVTSGNQKTQVFDVYVVMTLYVSGIT